MVCDGVRRGIAREGRTFHFGFASRKSACRLQIPQGRKPTNCHSTISKSLTRNCKDRSSANKCLYQSCTKHNSSFIPIGFIWGQWEIRVNKAGNALLDKRDSQCRSVLMRATFWQWHNITANNVGANYDACLSNQHMVSGAGLTWASRRLQV